MLDRPPTSSRSSVKPSRYPPCRVRKRSNNYVSEKRLVRASGQALCSPDTGAHGPSAGSARHSLRLKDRFALTHRLLFSGRSWDHINIRSPHNAQLLSTYRSVCLHNPFTCMGNRIDYLFERELDRTALSIGSLEHSLECDPDFSFSVFTFFRASWDYFFSGRSPNGSASMRTDLLLAFSSTAEHRLAADRSNQIFLYAQPRMRRHLRC